MALRRNPIARRPGQAVVLACLAAGPYGCGGEICFKSSCSSLAGQPNPALTAKAGRPPQPTDFASAPQSLTFSGDVETSITSGRPNTCGFGSGPAGAVFGFGLYFQVGQAWRLFSALTDPASQPFRGPGTYVARAWLGSIDSTGKEDLEYEGTVVLGIANALKWRGTVSGILHRMAGDGTVTISGGWTCAYVPQLGPG